MDAFWEHRRYIESISRSFAKQLDGIKQVMYNNQISFKQIFINENTEELPIIERLNIQGLITIETMIILQRLIKWMDKVECTNPIWEPSKARKLKYSPFLSVDNTKVNKIFIEHMKGN